MNKRTVYMLINDANGSLLDVLPSAKQARQESSHPAYSGIPTGVEAVDVELAREGLCRFARLVQARAQE